MKIKLNPQLNETKTIFRFMNKKAFLQDVWDLFSVVLIVFVVVTILGFVMELNVLSSKEKAKDRVLEVNILGNEIVNLRTQFEQGSDLNFNIINEQYDKAVKKIESKKALAEVSYDYGYGP